MKYIINQEYDKLGEENKTILFMGAVDNVYILNEIETQIWHLFDTPCSINEVYVKFNTINNKVKIREEDFFDFIKQLIIRRILIISND